MSDHKKTFSGVKIVQQPGGNSNYSVGWGHEESPVKKPKDIPGSTPVQESKNPETFESSTNKTVQNSGDAKKNKGVKIVNPPGGKSSFTFG